jgi:PiT family inorganic phosphate transporter
MDPFALVILVIIAALIFDFTNGWNDSANAIATIVSTRVMSPMTAVLWSASFNFIGALVSTKIAKSIGADVVNIPIAMESEPIVLAAMISGAGWVAWCTKLTLPISASHALIGSLMGAAVGVYGFDALQWNGVTKILIALFASPLLGFLVGFLLLSFVYSAAVGFRDPRVRRKTLLISIVVLFVVGGSITALFSGGALSSERFSAWFEHWSHSAIFWLVTPLLLLAFGAIFVFKGLTQTHARRIFGPLQICSSTFMAFEHGKNDAQKVMGVIALALFVGGMMKDANGNVITDPKQIEIPLWVMLACGAAISLGTVAGGWGVIRTLGTKLAHISSVDGFVAETTAGLVLETAAELGVPVSTTHTITGAILGVGSAKQIRAVKWGLGAKILYAWVFTLPVCFLLGATFSVVATNVGPLFLVTVAVLVTVLVVSRDTIRRKRAEIIEASPR